MSRFKPLYRYAGGKVKLRKIYFPFFQGLRPEYCVDYFGGSGSMSLWFHQLYPEAKLFLNEKDRALYGLWQCIKEQYEALLEEIQVLEANYAQCHGDKDTQKLWYYNDLRDYSYNETQVPP